ncbi:MAG: Nramp family divalent metal transporter [Planctomycetota bacterium]|nr:Nramp family divalent metal transporter [Planctomycetota bacterium]
MASDAPQDTPDVVTPTYKTPPKTWGGMLMAIGPAIVVSGSVIGSGELINVPIQAAKFGFVLFWAVILSCLIKYFLQVELGRYCLVHNRTTIQALNQVPGPKFRGTGWIGILYIFGYTISVVTVGGIMAATAGLFTSVMPLGSDANTSTIGWGLIIFAIVGGVLWFSLYGALEKLIAFLVCGFSLSVVVALLLLIFSPNPKYPLTMADVTSGMTFSLGEPAQRGAILFAVISLLGALGTTANEMFMYPYWILEKGYGDNLGSPDDEGWVDRAKGWIKVLQLDAGVATLLAGVITAAYFLVGCAILHKKGEVPSGMKVVEQLSQIYTETYGAWSYGVFMFGGFCTLFSTIVVVVAASGRMWTDLLSSMGTFEYENPTARRKYNRIFQNIYLAAFLGLTIYSSVFGANPAELVILGQWVNGVFNTPLLMIGVLYLAYQTDKRLRMSTVTSLLLIATAAAIMGCILIERFSSVFGFGGGGGH